MAKRRSDDDLGKALLVFVAIGAVMGLTYYGATRKS